MSLHQRKNNAHVSDTLVASVLAHVGKRLNVIKAIAEHGIHVPLPMGARMITQRPLSSSFLGLPCRILNLNHKKELLRGLWVE